MGEGEGERERKETDQNMSEAVGHGTVLVVFGNDILATAVEISEASCRHRCTVLTGRSLRVVTGESSDTDCEWGVGRDRSRWTEERTYVDDRVCLEPISKDLFERGLGRPGEDVMGCGGRYGPVGEGTWWEERKTGRVHAGNGVFFDRL